MDCEFVADYEIVHDWQQTLLLRSSFEVHLGHDIAPPFPRRRLELPCKAAMRCTAGETAVSFTVGVSCQESLNSLQLKR